MNFLSLVNYCRNKGEFTFWELENAGLGEASQVKLMLEDLIRRGKVQLASEANKCCNNGKGCGSCSVERFQIYKWHE